jgi:signal transduction histidine kinase/two-component SAPR family response regulator
MYKLLLIEEVLNDSIANQIQMAYENHIQIIKIHHFLDSFEAAPLADVIILQLASTQNESFNTIRTLTKLARIDTPIIVLTNHIDCDFELKAIQEGAHDIVTKHLLTEITLKKIIECSILRKKIESKIILEKEQASKDAKARFSFLATMSHEIRNPLNTIIGLSDFISNDYEKIETLDIKNHITTIGRVSRMLNRIIDDVLDLSKLESNEINLLPQNIYIKDFIESTLQMMEKVKEKNGNYITYSIDENLSHYLVFDADRLRQVILNLLSNANKFTKNGSIHLSFQQSKHPEKMLHISVKDNGIGIDSSKIENLFTPFKQAEDNTASLYGGTGLGLSISHHIIRIMNGSFSVFSKPGEGSTFSFTIPLIEGEEEEEGNQERENTPPFNSFKNDLIELLDEEIHILSVDDNHDNQNLIAIYLKDKKIKLTMAFDGQTALDLFKKQKFDLVLMDMMLPILSGYESTRLMRQWEKDRSLKKTPIIALTASIFKKEFDQCHQMGCSDYLSKPISKNNLFLMISKTISTEKGINNGQHCELLLTSNHHSVLIIDDNKGILELLTEEFIENGWKTYPASNTTDAFNILKNNEIHIVITDYAMPELSGFDFFKKCIESKRIPSNHFLFTSGHTEELIKRLHQYGHHSHKIFVKPFDIEVLIKEANYIVRKRDYRQ